MTAVKKEDALNDFLTIVKQSWTWKKLTESEKNICIDTFFSATSEAAIKGDYKARYNVCNAIYSAYLAGIGYSGWNWREVNQENPF